MNDLGDLRGAFALLDHRADTYLDHPARAHIGRADEYPATRSATVERRSRRLITTTGAALAVAAIAAVALVIQTHDHGPRPAPVRTAAAGAAPAYATMPLRSFVFSVPGRSAIGTDNQRDEQSVQLSASPSSGGQRDVVTAYSTSAARPFDSAGARKVSVNGRPGVYANVIINDLGNTSRGVAWRYGPGEWATVSGLYGDLQRADALALARHVSFGAASLLCPVSIDVGPATIRDWSASTGEQDMSYVLFRFDGHVVQESVQHTTARVSSDTTTVKGRTAYWSADRTRLDVALGLGSSLTIMTTTGRSGLVLRVARRTAVASDIDNRGTWFDAATALPR